MLRISSKVRDEVVGKEVFRKVGRGCLWNKRRPRVSGRGNRGKDWGHFNLYRNRSKWKSLNPQGGPTPEPKSGESWVVMGLVLPSPTIVTYPLGTSTSNGLCVLSPSFDSLLSFPPHPVTSPEYFRTLTFLIFGRIHGTTGGGVRDVPVDIVTTGYSPVFDYYPFYSGQVEYFGVHFHRWSTQS